MRPAAIGLTALLAAALSCGTEPDSARAPGASDPANGEETPTRAVRPTEYSTTLIVLSSNDDLSSSTVMEFSNYATSDSLRRRYSSWILRRSGWQSTLDEDWLDGPTRAPWRLFPTDSLRIVVSDDGDPQLLTVPGRRGPLTLELGDHLASWEDRVGTRHEIRIAQLGRGSQRTDGLAVQRRSAVPEPTLPSRYGAHQHAVLRSEDGAIIVIFSTERPELYGTPFAWMYADGLTQRWSTVETRTIEVASSSRLRRNVPVRMLVSIPEPGIRGEITAAAREFDARPTGAGPRPYHAVYRVSGWIEFGGQRRRVAGILERGEP